MPGVAGMDKRTVRLDGLGNKLCTGCSTWKPLTEYHLRSASPDGRHGWCKVCRNAGKKLPVLVEQPGTKTCRKCSTVKPVQEFNACAGNSGGLQAYCKPCAAQQSPATRDRHLRAKYGISSAEYDAMLAAQGGRCRICGSPDPKTKGFKNFAVDHCHKTGRVRGLLCVPCNLLIGYAQDDTETLRSAIAYLDF